MGNWYDWLNPTKWTLFKDRRVGISEAPDRPPTVAGDGAAGLFPRFSDPVRDLGVNAYQTIRRTDVTAQPFNKVAKIVAGMNLVAVGKGPRRDAIQKAIDSAKGLPDFIEDICWGRAEGVIFAWMRAFLVRVKESYYAPDLRSSIRRKYNAGGTYLWDGVDYSASGEGNIVKVNENRTSGIAWGGAPDDALWREARKIRRERVIVYRPGAGNNPEGNLDMAWQLYLIAEAAMLLDKSQRVYAERHSLPREVYHKLVDELRPDEQAAVLDEVNEKWKAANGRQRMVMPLGDMLKILEPSGTTWEFLTTYRRQLEERAHKVVCDEFITTMGSDSPSNSSKVGQQALNATAMLWARQISEALNNDLLPFIERINPQFPAYGPEEPEVYLELRPSSAAAKVTVGELVQLMEKEWPMPADRIGEIIGMEVAPELKGKFFVGKAKANPFDAPKMPNPLGLPPTKEDGGEQRKDRPPEESGFDKSQTAPRAQSNDLRNIKAAAE